MTIEEAIKKYCENRPKKAGLMPTDEYGYLNINIDFLNENKLEDQTQFDVEPALFDYGLGKCPDLVDLWKDFCKENNFKQNSVIGIHIVGAW